MPTLCTVRIASQKAHAYQKPSIRIFLISDFNWATRLPSEIAAQVCLEVTGKGPSDIAKEMYRCAVTGNESPRLTGPQLVNDYIETNVTSQVQQVSITTGSAQSQLS